MCHTSFFSSASSTMVEKFALEFKKLELRPSGHLVYSAFLLGAKIKPLQWFGQSARSLER